MKILVIFTFLINIVAMISLITGLIANTKSSIEPKKKATLGLCICISMIIYMFSIIVTCIFGLIKQFYFSLILLLFVVIPFIIGYYSNFNKVKLYTTYQIYSYMLSSILLGYIYIIL